MMKTDEYTDQIDGMIADEIRFLSDAKAGSFEDYKQRCGKIAGYRRALDEYRAFLERQRHDD